MRCKMSISYALTASAKAPQGALSAASCGIHLAWFSRLLTNAAHIRCPSMGTMGVSGGMC